MGRGFVGWCLIFGNFDDVSTFLKLFPSREKIIFPFKQYLQLLITSYTSVKFCFDWTRYSGVFEKKRNRYLCSLGVFLTNVSNILTMIV